MGAHNIEPPFDPHGILRADEEAGRRQDWIIERAVERVHEITDDAGLVADAVARFCEDVDAADIERVLFALLHAKTRKQRDSAVKDVQEVIGMSIRYRAMEDAKSEMADMEKGDV